jgi:hypothetical protein
MSRRTRWASAAALALWTGLCARARADGTTAADFLTVGLGPPSHESGATGPTARGVWMQDWNPAGIEGRREAYAAHEILPQGVSFDYLAGAEPIDSLGGTLGLALRTLTQGGISQLDNQGNAEGTFSARDLAFGVTWAQSWEGNRFGASGRVISQSIAGTSGLTESADLGWQREIGRGAVGAALTNLGPGLRMANQSFALPTALRAGASWPLLPGLEVSGAFSEMLGYGPSLQLGAHYRLAGCVVFGLGYQVGDTSSSGYNGFSAGSSLEIGPFRADVGFAPYGMLGSVIQVGLGYRFGKPRPAPERPVSSDPAPRPLPAPASTPAPVQPWWQQVQLPAPAPATPPEVQPAVQPPQPAASAVQPAAPPAPAADRWAHDW